MAILVPDRRHFRCSDCDDTHEVPWQAGPGATVEYIPCPTCAERDRQIAEDEAAMADLDERTGQC